MKPLAGTVQERHGIRESRLRALGYKDYRAYIHSTRWRRKRAEFWRSLKSRKCVCGAEAKVVHHRTYERLGEERLSDLIALCPSCHDMTHDLEKRGLMELGSSPVELCDSERAATNQANEAQRQARLARLDPDARKEKRIAQLRNQTERLKHWARQGINRDIDIADELAAIDAAIETIAERVRR